jgi:hypothetical protein
MNPPSLLPLLPVSYVVLFALSVCLPLQQRQQYANSSEGSEERMNGR